MTIISFEGLADDRSTLEIPDGYRGLNWKNLWAIDNEWGTAEGEPVDPNADHFHRDPLRGGSRSEQ